jgi:hypothetical protein
MGKSEHDACIKILGKQYRLQFVDRIEDDARGICDAPHARNKKIRILKKLQGEELIEVLFHEILHAGLWVVDEEIVDELAKDTAKVIWQLLQKDRI